MAVENTIVLHYIIVMELGQLFITVHLVVLNRPRSQIIKLLKAHQLFRMWYGFHIFT